MFYFAELIRKEDCAKHDGLHKTVEKVFYCKDKSLHQFSGQLLSTKLGEMFSCSILTYRQER